MNACKTLARPKNARSATRLIVASRFELPLLGSNQDSPDPESGVLPITPRGIGTTTASGAHSGSKNPNCVVRGAWFLSVLSQPRRARHNTVDNHAPLTTHRFSWS